ncbi:diguanylate cyclase [Corallincola platygyrae]|uniref:diguanylate cyclase n=1 Tax=Corallincola platygyrae TaxID=1193278 RepID=A0ABW4XIP8_9GAMM
MPTVSQTKSRRSRSLRQLVYSQFLRSSLIPIFVIEVALLLLYFGITHYIAERNIRIALDSAKLNIAELAIAEVHVIDEHLTAIERVGSVLQAHHQYLFTHFDHVMVANEPDFETAENGAWVKKGGEGASLYYSAETIIGSEQLEKAVKTEEMDPLLQQVVDQHDSIVAAYFNSWDNMNRLYPYIDNVADQYGPHINMEDYNFYYLADAKHNPDRKPVWTNAYLDPAGQGWMISNIFPIYRGDFLEGVSGLDITLPQVTQTLESLSLPWQSGAMILDDTGTVLSMTPEIEVLLGIQELTTHEYNEVITETIVKPWQFNLYQNDSDSSQLLKQALQKAKVSGPQEFELNGEGYILVVNGIETTNWLLVMVTPKAVVFEEIYHQRRISSQIGYAAIAFMVLFYLMFFVYLMLRSRQLANKIVEPIAKLSQMVHDAVHSSEKPGKQPVNLDVAELDYLADIHRQLSEANHIYQSMVKEVTRKNAQLERISETDSLTQLNNRLKLDRSLAQEVKRAERYGEKFSVIMLDLDHFKRVNDNFGHQVGDSVLIELAELIKAQVRESDIVGRWGGEEFMVICPNTAKEQGALLAEKLHRRVEANHFSTVGKQTASFGVSGYRAGDNVESLVERADVALYRAKANGRNRIEIEHL